MTATESRTAPAKGEPAAKSYNPNVHERVVKMKEFLGLTNETFAHELGVSATETSKYLNKKPAGDVDGLERSLVDWLAGKMREQNAPRADSRFVRTNVSDQAFTAADTVRETLDFGMMVGPAGCQKTISLRQYVYINPTALMIEVTDDNASRAGVARLLMPQLRNRSVGDYETAWAFLRAKLKGSGRLLIVDQAHQLADSGYRSLFDLHDSAEIPVLLSGNEAMITDIRGRRPLQRVRNEQRSSRVGFKLELRPFDDGRFQFYTDAQLRDFVELHLKRFSSDFFALCKKISRKPGYLRSLHKHLLLVMRAVSGYDSDVECLRDAHDMLLTETPLED